MTSIQRDQKSFSRKLIAGILIVGLTFGSTLWAQPMMQGPDDQRPDEQRRDQQQKNNKRKSTQKAEAQKAAVRYPEPGEIALNIPGGYDTVHSGPNEYIFYDGIFYTRDPKGFRVVDAPRGVIVRTLPVGFETLLVAGVTYFVFAGVYYNRADAGYVVVEAPPAQPVTTAAAVVAPVGNGTALAVDVELLNVRSGPGLNHSVVSRVRSGDTITIQGTSGEWYYVALPDGSYGWVMAKFTRQLFPDAQG